MESKETKPIEKKQSQKLETSNSTKKQINKV